MVNLKNITSMNFDGQEITKILGATQGTIWVKDTEFRREVIHSEDNQYIYTGAMNSGDYILEGRFRLNYIDPPTDSGDGNWIIGGRQTGAQTLGIFSGKSGLFVAYGGATSAQLPNLLENVWYTYRMNINNITFTTDDGVSKTYNYPSGGKLIPVANQVEIGICNVTNGYTGGVELRRMWGDHDYHKCTDRATGEVLYQFEAGVDKNGIACFKNSVNGELKYSESGTNFLTVDDVLKNEITTLNTMGIETGYLEDVNKQKLAEIGVI